MNMVWLAILTLIAGSTSGSVASRDLRSVCLAAKPRIGVAEGVPVRTHLQTIARRVDGVPRTPPWSSPLLEEFDTPEVDETWMVDLDVRYDDPHRVDLLGQTTIFCGRFLNQPLPPLPDSRHPFTLLDDGSSLSSKGRPDVQSLTMAVAIDLGRHSSSSVRGVLYPTPSDKGIANHGSVYHPLELA